MVEAAPGLTKPPDIVFIVFAPVKRYHLSVQWLALRQGIVIGPGRSRPVRQKPFFAKEPLERIKRVYLGRKLSV